MPNWVYSNLDIQGDAAEVARLKEQVSQPYTILGSIFEDGKMVHKEVEQKDEFSFWNIIHPEGEQREKYDASIGMGGATPFWYDWNCSNWGVKWDASDVSIDVHGPDHIRYSFSTAWNTPMCAMETLSTQYPSLTFTMEWEEEQGFGGTYEFSEGMTTELDYYDIPSTHAELMDRKGYCYRCEDGYYEPDDLFEDCPNRIPEDMRVPENELVIEVMN